MVSHVNGINAVRKCLSTLQAYVHVTVYIYSQLIHLLTFSKPGTDGLGSV